MIESGLFVLFGLLSLGLPVLVLVLAVSAFVRTGRIQREQRALLDQVAALRGELRSLRERGLPVPPPAPGAVPSAPAASPADAAQPPRAEPVAAAAPAPAAEPAPSPVAPAPPPIPGTRPAAEALPPAPLPPPPPAAPAQGLEERLGTRLFTWLGSIALFLAGAYLVKFTFDQGLLGPTARVVLGLVFGVALLAGGELLRGRSALVATGLSAAGIADLYASLYAGTSLYHLVPAPVGFALMALVTATAVLLSLRHGVLIAVIGLIGGFLTPALVGETEPSAAVLFLYLFLLQAGLVGAARPRRWWGLALATAGGGALWAAAWLAWWFRPGDELVLGLFVLASAALFGVAATLRTDWREPQAANAIVVSSALSSLALLAVTVVVGDYGASEWLFLGLLAAGCLAAARLRPALLPLAAVAAAVGLVLIARWAGAPEPPPILRWAALGYGGLIVLGSYLALRGAPRADLWAALCAGSAVAYFIAAWSALRIPTGLDPAGFPAWRDIPWGPLSIALGALLVGLAAPWLKGRGERPGAEGVLGALAAAATFFAGAAVPFEIGRFSLTAAWAIEAAALAWLAGRLALPVLRHLALALGAIVLVRLFANPELLGYDTGGTPVFNWILFGYGVPLAAFALAAFLFRRDGTERPALAFEWGTIALALGLDALEVRHYFHWSPAGPGRATGEFGLLFSGGDPFLYVAEAGAIAVLWLALGLGLAAWSRRAPRPGREDQSRAVLALGIGAAVALPGVAANPLLHPLEVGATPVFNTLLFAYGVTSLFVALAGRVLARLGNETEARIAGAVALLGAWALITLEVRQAFHGSRLVPGETGSAELYSYSAAWIVLGVALLVGGLVTRSLTLRWASLVVMLAAVLKVFLWDLSELRDLYRVFSLLGLGASLLLLAFLYQKVVFRRPGPPRPDGPGRTA
jgi:uncharacterized membrane protein